MSLRILRVELGEGEIVVGIMIFPEVRNLSSSPKPEPVDLVVALLSVHSVGGQAVLAEVVVQVSEMSVFQVVSQISDNSFTLVFNVLNLPDRPALNVQLSPKLLQSSGSVW